MIPVIQRIELERIAPGSKKRFWLHLVSDGIGTPILLPILVAKGKKEGPVLGLTAAVHGNELNGIPVIQRAFKELNVEELSGTVIGVPVVNVPSFLQKKRRFIDGRDLNHIMPGIKNGNVSQVYAYRLFRRIVRHFDFLLDLHTASVGRVNSYYIRADLSDPVTKRLALLQNAQIVVDNPPADGTLRGAAEEANIPAITLEVGDPNTFQKGMIRSGLTGLFNVLSEYNMIEDTIEDPVAPSVICNSSYWLYTDVGGLLRVFPKVTEFVKAGDRIADIHNVFGDLVKTYTAPEDGIVIGKSVSPVAQTGARILHLGLPRKTQ